MSIKQSHNTSFASENAKTDKSKSLKEISGVIRALVTSRKPPCSLNDILRDYHEVECKSLPFRQFGFKNAEELLLETGEFQLNKFGGQTYITAKFNTKSAHIAALVAGQKRSKAKPSLLKSRAPMRSDQSWNKSQYSSQVYRHLSNSGNNANTNAGDRNNNQVKLNRNHYNNNVQQKTTNKSASLQNQQHQQQQQQQQQQQTQKQQQATNKVGNGKAQYDLRERLNQQHNESKVATKPRPILGQKSTSSTSTNNAPAKPQQRQQEQQKPRTQNNAQFIAQPTNLSGSKIQDRLKIQMAAASPIRTATPAAQYAKQNNMTANIAPVQNQYDTQPVMPPKVFQFNPKLDAITSLSQYCVVRRYPVPQYNTLHSKYSKLYQCRVMLNGSIYSTYPNEYPSEMQAKLSCAQIAIDQIRQQEARNPMPLCTDADDVLIDKLYKELLQHSHGIFVKNMPECFENAYKQALPDHWWTLVQTSNRFLTEMTAGDKVIILANTQAVDEVVSSPLPSPSAVVSKNGFAMSSNSAKAELETLCLPWQTKYWNVYVTYCVSTVEVYVRLIGPEYSDHYDAVYSEIEREQKTRASTVRPKTVYLVFVADSWHRVLVRELQQPKGLALCHFIDFGDTEWLSTSNLYVCDAKYLSLPAQAVALSLFGLEDFAEHPVARSILDAQLLNNSFVAEILTKDSEFYVNNSRVQAVLYDTSSDVDINKNPILLQLFCDSTPAPELKRSSVTKVHITGITDNGDIYIQILGAGLHYVEKLIQQLVESKFKRDQHIVNAQDLQRSDLFLICDENEQNTRWYRGKLAQKQANLHNNMYNINFVDQGFSRHIHIGNMFRLESLSTALSKFPAQAIKVQLHNIPPITDCIVGRMRALLAYNCEALVKLVVPADVPLVTVYRRIEGPDTLCTINDVLRIEHELESSLDTNSDFTEAAEAAKLSPSTELVTNKFNYNMPKTNNSINTDDLRKLPDFNDFPGLDQFFNLRVSLAANPSNMIVQPHMHYKELCELMKNLQTYCENNNTFIPAAMIEIGQAYAAKNPDGYYHRIIVEKKISDEMINVRFCDFGDCAALLNTQLKPLPAEYRSLPKMAIAAKLYDTAPIDGDWSVNDCKRFRELTLGKKFVSVIQRRDKDKNGETLLELELIDVETAEDIYIREVLRAEGRIK